MAIYKNKIVSVMGNPQLETKLPLMIQIVDSQGQYFTVPSREVKFTKDEFKAANRQLEEDAKNKIPVLQEATDEEIEAAKNGLTPPNDPETKQLAMIKLQHEKSQELTRKNNEKALAEAKKEFDAQQSKTSVAKVA